MNTARRRFRIHPVLWLIYGFLRILSFLCMNIYYRRRVAAGTQHARTEPPFILVSNHPSTLMDVLNVGIHVPRILFFLANYGLFKHPVSNWLLSRLYCIPIKRREDVPEGAGRNNDIYFEQSFQHLEKGGCLYIAPEGNSWMQRRVRSFKTGTARIAFNTEARNDFQLGLTIVPAGLTYYAPEKFGSDMVVQFGAPVIVREHADAWRADPEKAIDDLTLLLENRVKALCLHTRDENEECFLGRLETLAATHDPLPLRDAYNRSRSWSKTLLNDKILNDKTAHYFGLLTETRLNDRAVYDRTDTATGGVRPLWQLPRLLMPLFLVLTFPLFAIGYAFWWLPCRLPAALARRMKLYIGYDSNVKTLTGIFTFSIVWYVLYRTGTHWLPVWQSLLLIPLSIGFGLFTERYLLWAADLRYYWTTNRLDRRVLEDLVLTRREIVQQMEEGLRMQNE